MDKPGYNQVYPHNANQIIIMNIKVYKILQKNRKIKSLNRSLP